MQVWFSSLADLKSGGKGMGAGLPRHRGNRIRLFALAFLNRLLTMMMKIVTEKTSNCDDDQYNDRVPQEQHQSVVPPHACI